MTRQVHANGGQAFYVCPALLQLDARLGRWHHHLSDGERAELEELLAAENAGHAVNTLVFVTGSTPPAPQLCPKCGAELVYADGDRPVTVAVE